MPEIRIVSSMATRHLLGELVAAFSTTKPEQRVTVVSMGGVEAAKRVAAGEPFDAVVLASAALDTLASDGHILRDSIVTLVQSPIAAAVRAGAPRPAIASEDDVRRAVLSARRIGYSTGPSGDYLVNLFRRWGIAGSLEGRLVQAPPGTPVASLLAQGDVDLGFQQLSELLSADAIDVLGPLPPAIQSMTTFAGGITAVSSQKEAAGAALDFMASPEVEGLKRRYGMEPV